MKRKQEKAEEGQRAEGRRRRREGGGGLEGEEVGRDC